jgi:diguanylate cyclase (GGDEF)-like protein
MAPAAPHGPKDLRAGRWPERLSWLREICFVSFGRDPLTSKIRRAQVAALREMLPATNAVALLNAILLVIALRHSVPAVDLAMWLSTMVMLVGVRLYHVLGGGKSEATPLSVYVLVLVSALMWSVPPLLWHDYASPDDRVLIFLVTAGMMCGACLSLGSMPIACWTYVLVVGSVMIGLGIHVGQPILAAMTAVFTVMLCWIGLRHARRFVDHQRDSIELAEQAELVKLMREFKASGSGWLWETNAQLIVTYLTNDGGRLSLRRIRRLLGRSVGDILDPAGRTTQVSEGAQELFSHFEQRTPFRDIAVPTPQGRWWSLSGKPLFEADGRFAGWRGLGSDITESRVDGQDAVQAVRRDPLTGLANRLLVRETIEEALLWAPANACALLLVDLDRFKLVNDTLGHAVGDMLLKEVAGRLIRTAGNKALVGRLGGDEFAILFPGTVSRPWLASLADRMVADLSEAYVIGALELHIGATVGIAVAPDDAGSQEELTTSADLALYRAKEEGRGTHCFYEQWMSERAQAHRQMESDLRRALQSGGLSLVYQPFVEAAGSEIVGYEALLRWRHPTLGDIPPDRFVPIIEDAGLMNQIGTWVIREACAEAGSWKGQQRIAVNVSATQINGASLAGTVVTALAESGLTADRLELEVTETIFLGDDEATLSALAGLRSLGVRLVIDDFGKGYSSFGYLARAHFSKIKIDQSFVRGAAQGARESVAIVCGMLALAGGLGVETTAEGIETAAEADVMRALGCTHLQGFLFGRPAPARHRAGRARRPVPVERRRAAQG